MTRKIYSGARIFDGATLHEGAVLVVEHGRISGMVPESDAPDGERIALEGGVLSPGFVDLQVNGGGGVQFNDDTSVEALRIMSEAHASTGTAAILPTLITDTPDRTLAAIDAVETAVAQGVPGIAGLHLEGPHLALSRKGAHDGGLIRAMTDADLEVLMAAAHRLPLLKLTVAPESVRPAQIARLVRAGALVALGHSDCSYDNAMAAFSAGASCVTHLFNAMSPLRHREPGLVGAALDAETVSAGLIADGVHVHPAAIRAAVAAKRGQDRIYLVTDAMAPLASQLQEFRLNGRRVLRRDGRLTLEDGTLAGADVTLPQAIRIMIGTVGLPLSQVLAMATSVPGRLLGRKGAGRLCAGELARLVHLAEDGSIRKVA